MTSQTGNIAAGTQVVSLVEVRGTNNSLVHPRGAVGVVTRTPTGDQKHYLVLFADGFEAQLHEARALVRVEAHRGRPLAVKRRQMPWAKVDTLRNELHRDFQSTQAETRLSERPEIEKPNEYLIGALRSQMQ